MLQVFSHHPSEEGLPELCECCLCEKQTITWGIISTLEICAHIMCLNATPKQCLLLSLPFLCLLNPHISSPFFAFCSTTFTIYFLSFYLSVCSSSASPPAYSRASLSIYLSLHLHVCCLPVCMSSCSFRFWLCVFVCLPSEQREWNVASENNRRQTKQPVESW